MTPKHPDYSTWPVREQIRYCLAREIWTYRDERAPNKELIGDVTRFVTWAEVFRARFDISLEDYVREITSKT